MDEITPGVAVRSIDNPGRIGTVTNAEPRHKSSGLYVQIRWADGVTDYLHVEELEPVDSSKGEDLFTLIRKSQYGRSTDLRRNLTFVHLAGRLANLVYAMGITETDFYPHQYRPLLTLLESPAQGIVIADEVGLGKTIEAGLIWTELRARFDFRRLLVVCPAMLREKWRSELRNRFGVKAQIADADKLLDDIKQPLEFTPEGTAWIIGYEAARPPTTWRVGAAPITSSKRNPRLKLAEFLDAQRDAEPVFDLVIFDEAHYMRNRENSQWKLGELLRDCSMYQALLTATPINLRNRDLFNLLHLIDPDNFSNELVFQWFLDANRPLVEARDVVLNRSRSAADIVRLLEEAKKAHIFWDSGRLERILQEPPTDAKLADISYRASLADKIERLSLLSHVLIRTRKRDVSEQRIVRSVRREMVTMSAAERTLYDTVTKTIRKYALERGISDGFLLSMPQRQVSSSPLAVTEAWFGSIDDIDELITDLEAERAEPVDEDQPDWSLKDALRAAIPAAVDLQALHNQDTKYERLLAVAGEFLTKHPNEKIILFTTFRATARYLARNLSEAGFPASLLLGGQEQNKQEVVDNFRESKTDLFLISTEVASEGVDLQFCRVLVNYDLPWNPTRIEQRIGRIDRLGQDAELIHVWNLYFHNTVDSRIVERLFDRLRIFEEALGEAEAVVGDTVRKLESDLFERPLSKEEESERIERAAQALENLRLQREELEKNAPHMMAHGQRVIERIEAAKELSRRVSDYDLFVYVKDYLELHAPGHRFEQIGPNPHEVRIKLPPQTAIRLNEYMSNHGMQGRSALGAGQTVICRFLNKISASAPRGTEIVHQFHPLIRFVTSNLRERGENFFPLIAVLLHSPRAPEGLPNGDYAFLVRRWSFGGVREEEILAVAALEVRSKTLLEDSIADLLLQAARLEGSDWPEASTLMDPDYIEGAVDELEAELSARYKQTLKTRKEENEDRANLQRQAVTQHMNRRLGILQEVFDGHQQSGREPLAAATRGQMDKLRARMDLRLEEIDRRQVISADKFFVCAGVVRVASAR